VVEQLSDFADRALERALARRSRSARPAEEPRGFA
jgi:hypothetical protein